jgi:hypothetical protein
MSGSSTAVTVWLDDDAYLSQRPLKRHDGTSWRALSWYDQEHRELVSLYLTIDQADDLYRALTTSYMVSEDISAD